MTHYKLVKDRSLRRAQRPCWTVEKRSGTHLESLPNYFPSPYKAVAYAAAFWPDLSQMLKQGGFSC